VSAPAYRGFSREELEFHFDPRTAAPDHAEWRALRQEASARARSALRSWLDLAYGGSPRQKIDIFPSLRQKSPVLLYFHGGYWRGGSKEENAFFAELFTRAGATVALAGYDLCPQVTVSEIVRQARAAIAWVHHNVGRYGGDPDRLYLCGVSAGAHLVAMALAHDWSAEGLPAGAIKGATLVSGVYDLDAVLHLEVNAEIRLTPAMAKENSPFLHPPRARVPLVIAVGAEEPAGWKRMSEDYFELCRGRGLEGEFIEVPGTHHFSLSHALADGKSPLARAVLKQMGLGGD
jgi:arylformamidase